MTFLTFLTLLTLLTRQNNLEKHAARSVSRARFLCMDCLTLLLDFLHGLIFVGLHDFCCKGRNDRIRTLSRPTDTAGAADTAAHSSGGRRPPSSL